MGMIACYMEADKELIDKLKTKTDEELFEEVEILAEEENIEIYDMDKMWDGLHFLLTGVSASTPIENGLLSEAIVGTSMFSDDKNSDFISYIYPIRVHEILSALDKFDIDNTLTTFSPEVFAKSGIYPTIWMKGEKDSLREELSIAFQELRQFYRTMADKHKGIIVSIY
ncbi:protein of unknown function [Anaerocolumna jejuensis DSM 15929]|uniref:Uncharacterized protein n=1 Tax=Anaerocolumna jejuensis DSM 15929 TaxID=1121322 RepID=A0A1M6Y9L7_9FIRM|nr:YfbM family protein [Anaerocolumna jejuensis]SHL14977.1 protein of unknown function [Anaerocolumna jejuensis DSM 15929]